MADSRVMEELKERHLRWLHEEGGIEGATHVDTLEQPEQQRRIAWLVDKCKGTNSILDIGCNWGYILDAVHGEVGIDSNIENVRLARKRFPRLKFIYGDITEGLWYGARLFDIVIMAELLEHLNWQDVFPALREGLRVAREKVLITLPWRKDDKCALCFKHHWVPDELSVREITEFLGIDNFECDDDFVFIEVNK